MKDITKILVPFDLTTTTDSALHYAANFVNLDESIEILLIHTSDASDEASYEKKVKDKVEYIKKEYPYFKGSIRWVITTGDIVQNILETQKEYLADLIIMGTKGAESDQAVTNTSKLVLEADCPVIAIPEGTKEFELKKIALVLGKNEIEDATVLEILLNIARRFHAEVHVLTICNEDGTYGYSAIDEKNETTLEYYLENFYSHHTFQENTDIEKGIFDYINDKEIDLLAILPRNHSKKTKPSEGRLTQLLTLHTSVPLLTID
ncbi:universal stress protein [Aquimarina sp. MMG016]|uniref:universal stress protein n=1 Tax=Aquimarina sp. MMG016 TaxID=2822690 RepID=UPI001B3A5B39|nr:universal stress protein [Aquimarina sp. MMG016]MBQ4820956.1 universal stress protein [Aquimarina sp. MMG016]